MTRFKDRVAIVTGAGSPTGLGVAVVRQLVAEGARVVLGATTDRVHERASEFGDAAIGVVADLTVDGAADVLVREAMNRWGRLDVLVNNAGMTSVSSGWDADDDVADLSLADWDAAMARWRHYGLPDVSGGRSGDAVGWVRTHRHGRVHHRHGQCDARSGDLHRSQGRPGGTYAGAGTRGGP
ncbi:MAG: SDR family NAD(P)-dependent oxidoreductase [Mycolicibacterium sp.]|nr:SDR family NAD(P)-dependent oxidoreductase [Mycolicibacterium sp.]